MNRICNSDDTAAVEKYRQWSLRRSVPLCSPPPVSKRLFSECTSRGTQRPTNIYDEENIAVTIQANPRISTRRISTNLNILCLTVGWMWQTEGRIRTTFGAFSNVNLLHCTVGWNFATGLMLNPQRFLIYLPIRLIFPAMESTIAENPTYRSTLIYTTITHYTTQPTQQRHENR